MDKITFSKVQNKYQTKNNFENLKRQIYEMCIRRYFDTAQKNIIEEIKQEQKSHGLPVLVINELSSVEQINKSFQRMSKFNKEEIVQNKLDIILPNNIRKEHSDFVSDQFKKEQVSTNIKKKIKKCSTLVNKQDSALPIVMTTEMKVYVTEDKKQQLAIVMLSPPEEAPTSSITDPNGYIQLFWMMVVSTCLVLVLIILPYNLLFYPEDVGYFDYVTDSVFITDIFLSFNTGYYENDDDETYISDRYKIAKNQVKGFFITDVVTSMPYYLLPSNDESGGNEFRTFNLLKFLRLYRIAKVLKLSRLFKMQKLLMYQQKNRQGLKILEKAREQQQHFTIIQLIGLLFISAHYQALIFITFQYQPTRREDSWLNQTQIQDTAVKDQKPADLQKLLLQEHISVSLGQNRLEQFNFTELLINLVWMVVGIGLLSQVLGSVNLIIQQINSADYAFKSKLDIIDKISYEKKVSEETLKLVHESLYLNKEKVKENSIGMLMEFVNADTQKQLQKEAQARFVGKFMFLKEIELDQIQIWKDRVKYKKNKYIYKINSYCEELYMVCSGRVNVMDSDSKFLQEVEQNEMLGQEEFQEWTRINMTSIIKEKLMGKKKADASININDMQKIYRQNSAISEDETLIMSISYNDLIYLSILDKKLLNKLKMQQHNQKEQVTKKDIGSTKKTIKDMLEHKKPMMIMLNDGTIYLTNYIFNKKFKEDIQGVNIVDVLWQRDWNQLSSQKFHMTEFQLLIKARYWEVEVSVKYRELIIRKQYQQTNGTAEYSLQKVKCMFLTLVAPSDSQLHVNEQMNSALKKGLNLRGLDNYQLRKERNIRLYDLLRINQFDMTEFGNNEYIQIRKIENKQEEAKIADLDDFEDEVKKEEIGEIKNKIAKGGNI